MKQELDRRQARLGGLATAAAAMALLVGCNRGVDNGAIGDGPAADQARTQPDDGDRRTDADAAAAGDPMEEPPVPALPPVVLSEAHAATVLVKVGDEFPDATLPDWEGNQQSLASLRGERLTVVLFWSSDNIHSTVALEDLEADVGAEYADRGVHVVGINVKDTVEAAKQAVSEAGAKFPNLLDQDGSLLSRISTGRPPLVYLLDSQGKAIWLDIEYSRETRRLLGEAIEFVLQEA